ncbi:hypothetical protein PAXRUDRAFT_36697 [Paxillus rubicundulus Ve08.2h10]|uniref:Uncharacterized protein n=1 Tax=Paxillus rubicundulus Ve08.2h10 TaxID=930991 RepID=A0A0D0DBW2_9AGAM|nr:hypothetical protein PAXRUDRAFT_36697 [Paxillus rubicundulus Ve08.2h10]
MQPFCPNLWLVDSHSTADTKSCSEFTYQVKPNLCVYSDASSIGCDSSRVEVIIKFKWDHGQDPFCQPMFVSCCNTALNTLGQITAYASAQLTSQFCTHCFSILVIQDITYIIRWD